MHFVYVLSGNMLIKYILYPRPNYLLLLVIVKTVISFQAIDLIYQKVPISLAIILSFESKSISNAA